MKKLSSLLLVLCFPLCYCMAQENFSLDIYAGSTAQFGENQSLVIDAKGNCRYRLTEVGAGVKDSSSFTLSKNELKELSVTFNQNGFFKFGKSYVTNAYDGDGMMITVRDSGKSNKVLFRNKHTAAMDKILKKINEVIAKHKIIPIIY